MPAASPPTGQHTVEDDLRDEALAYFFKPEQQATTTPTTGGVNNIVQYVSTADGHKYVLRIYNNGNKTEKVRRHGVRHHTCSKQRPLQPQLQQQVPALAMPAAACDATPCS